MDCLNCHLPLFTVNESHFLTHLMYHVCDHCGGMWLDKGALDRMAFQTPGSVETSSTAIFDEETRGPVHPYRPFPPRCLRCDDHQMTKMHFMGESRILLDYCEVCGGLWIDGGELTKINQHIRWFDRAAKPSKFGRFLTHARSTFFHRIDVKK